VQSFWNNFDEAKVASRPTQESTTISGRCGERQGAEDKRLEEEVILPVCSVRLSPFISSKQMIWNRQVSKDKEEKESQSHVEVDTHWSVAASR
jgi:hypothetical protein